MLRTLTAREKSVRRTKVDTALRAQHHRVGMLFHVLTGFVLEERTSLHNA